MKNKVIKAIESALDKLDIKSDIELTPAKGHGDFSTNIALKLSAKLNEKPIDIAEKIKMNIEAKFISKVEIAEPGFINIFLNSSSANEQVEEIIIKGSEYGKGNQNKYINVEYVSANPTGWLHMGHARGAALGDSLSRILKFAGNKVDEEYYVNDAGNQIDVLADSVIARMEGKELPNDSYHGQDIIELAKEIKSVDREDIKDEARNKLLEIIKADLKSFDVEIDTYSSELEIKKSGAIEETLEKLKDHIFEEGGATWLDTTSKGDDKDRVLIKTDGSNTYLLPDIAYHDIKLSRGYDQLINIWGADHIGYIKRMEVALEYLGLKKENLDILTVQLVKLVRDGEELKMSKRAGTTYTLKELIALGGKDAARFDLVNRANTSSLEFDIDLALKQTNENPVFTIQYTHARTHSLISKSNVEPKIENLGTDEESLVAELTRFPDLIETIANTHKVHLLPQYLIDLAKEFNSLYSNKPFIGNENEATLIGLAKATQVVIKNGLNLIGVSAPEKM